MGCIFCNPLHIHLIWLVRSVVFDKAYWTKVAKRLLIFFFTCLGIFLAFKFAIFYIPFLIAFIISLFIEPAIRFINNKTSLERKKSAIIVLVIFAVILISLLVFGIVAIISESSNLLQGLNGYIEKIYNKGQELLSSIDFNKIRLPEGLTDILNNSSQDFLNMVSEWLRNTLSNILQIITQLPTIFIYVGITFISTYFICTDKFYILDQIEHHLPRTWVNRLMVHLRKIISSLGSYLKAEAILVGISFVITIIGLYIMNFIGLNVEYPFLAALAIGFVDALPILGSGTVIIPWAVISALDGNISLAIALFILLVVVSIVRQLAEPKLVSKHIGIHPIFTLIAMYTGFKAIGIFGLLIGPIILIILNNVFETLIDKGLVKSIFDRK